MLKGYPMKNVKYVALFVLAVVCLVGASSLIATAAMTVYHNTVVAVPMSVDEILMSSLYAVSAAILAWITKTSLDQIPVVSDRAKPKAKVKKAKSSPKPPKPNPNRPIQQ